MKVKKINSKMVEHWIGSDHQNTAEYLRLLTEIINGEYLVDEFRDDVLDLWGEDDESND